MPQRREEGTLEAEVLGFLWRAERAMKPAEVRGGLSGELAYTTVMTVLSRLWQKGLVGRRQAGRAYEYFPLVTEGELAAKKMRAALVGIRDREGALSQFVGKLGKRDETTLRRLLRELDRDSR